MRTGAAAQPGARPGGYFDQARPDVAALVPPECRRVLDVGCGTGQLGRLLRGRGHHVTGVELIAEAAALARTYLDHVIVADVESGLSFPPASFDAVIFADVLEHLVDPWRILRETAKLLVDGGCVIASVPNVQNIDVLWRLARGRWDYRDRGILDRGHLRFFTLATIHDLFTRAGLTLTHVGHRYRRSLWRALVSFLTAGRAQRLFARQYLVVGRRNAPAVK
jgi:SAM-dependent methyltransferase